ncbi:uncharacterized protein V2V93DRAFT_363065 [Kockiozyma suomiensis]|uniref:uncharacterized protein n=1 Tax=Kockiozyma suomiensis TaxID=1337062 RepID=UPI003343BE12
MFPSYARRLENGLVEVDIRGWVYAPGAPNRKNRIFTSVVRQLVGMNAEDAESETSSSQQSSETTTSSRSPASSIYASSSRTAIPSATNNNYSSYNIPKNTSSISVGSVLSASPSDRGSPSPSRRGSSSQFGSSRHERPTMPASEAVMIPQSTPKSGRSVSFSRTARSYSPSTRGYSASPRRDTYSSAAQQARGIRADDISGAVINKNFVQPTLVGERQPLLSSSPSTKRNNGYLINLESDTESDYSSGDEDDEVVENHHETLVVDHRNSPVRSLSGSVVQRPKYTPTSSSNDIRRQQSFYSNQANASMISIAGHNSEVVAANSDNAPLSSPTVSKGSYFPDYTRRGSILNLSRTFSIGAGSAGLQSSPSASPLKIGNGKNKARTFSTSTVAGGPPPLPPRPNLISFPSMYNAEKTMQERIAPFISRPISYETITINVGSTETEEYSTYNVITTDSGHFGVRLRLAYEPAISCVECGDDMIAVDAVKVIEPYGVSVISDVDDTVKHTGITGAKKGIFRNVFVKDYSELEIKGVADWYQRLSKMGVPIHYVSNSPWQLYPSISKFLRRAGLPEGTMHLKHYNGFLYGLLEPAVERKRFNLESILADFPNRKFVLVGDSGEMDLEAYVNLACNFPDQVLAIYIRDVTTTCSDDDDFCTTSQLNGFFTSSVPRPDEIDDLLVDDSGWCCTGPSDPDRFYNRPHSPPPLMPKPEKFRSKKITTAPTATSTQWTSTPTSAPTSEIKEQQLAHEAQSQPPKVPRKPSSLKSQPINLAQPQPNYAAGAKFDLLSSSAGSATSPLAERLAAFSSTFDSGSPESPEQPNYMSIHQQPQPQQQIGSGKMPSAHVTSSTGLNGTTGATVSSLSSGIKASKNGSVKNYNSIQQQEQQHSEAANKSQETTFSASHPNPDHHKPPLPPRPGSILRSAAGAAVAGVAGVRGGSNRQHASDIASYAYRACIGTAGRGGNSDDLPMDKKLALWKKRVARARMMLPNGIRLRMWRIGDDVSDECEAIVESYLEQLENEAIA